MPRHRLAGLAVAATLILCAALPTAAAASEMTIAPAGAIAAPSVGRITIRGGVFSVRCALTLNGSLLRGPIRTEGTEQIGSISEVAIQRGCEGGTLERALFEAGSWTMTLARTLGTAPNSVTGLLFKILAAKLFFPVFGEAVNCLYAGDLQMLLTLSRTRATGVYTTSNVNTLAARDRGSGGTFCPEEVALEGTFTVTTQTVTIV